MQMQTIQNTVIGALESVKTRLELADEAVVKRDKVFATIEKEAESAESAPAA